MINRHNSVAVSFWRWGQSQEEISDDRTVFPQSRGAATFRCRPIASHIDGFARLLASQGYARATAKEKLRLAAELSRWLERRRIELLSLDEQRVKQFLTDRRRGNFANRGSATTCSELLRYLRELGSIPWPTQAIDESPLHRIEHDFGQFLALERGLTPASLSNYLPIVRRFLTERFGSKALRLDELRPQDVHRFVLSYANGMSRTRAKLMVTALRSFLRFLQQRGDIATDRSA